VLPSQRIRPSSWLTGVSRAVEYPAARTPSFPNLSGQILVKSQQHLEKTRLFQHSLVQRNRPLSFWSTKGDASSAVLSTSEDILMISARPPGADDDGSRDGSDHDRLWAISFPIADRDHQRPSTHRLPCPRSPEPRSCRSKAGCRSSSQAGPVSRPFAVGPPSGAGRPTR